MVFWEVSLLLENTLEYSGEGLQQTKGSMTRMKLFKKIKVSIFNGCRNIENILEKIFSLSLEHIKEGKSNA